jgi:hypothetical protein
MHQSLVSVNTHLVSGQIAHLKLPVRSEAPGRSNSCVRKFAPRLTNFRLKSQPNTPPVPLYRVPDTTSKFLDFCFLINSGMNFGCKANKTEARNQNILQLIVNPAC